MAPSLRSQGELPPSGPQAVAVIFGEAAAGAGVRLGSSAPDFQWVDSAGRIQELAGQRGRTVVLNFWATWCVPCRTELPILERAATAHPEITFMAIDLQEEAEPVRTLFDALGLTAVEPVLDIGGQIDEERIASGLRKATVNGG